MRACRSPNILARAQFSNVYVPSPFIGELHRNPRMQRECLEFIVHPAMQGRPPPLRRVFKLYGSLKRGVTMRELAHTEPLFQGIVDPRKFAVFGVINNLIRRLRRFPTFYAMPSAPTGSVSGVEAVPTPKAGDATTSVSRTRCAATGAIIAVQAPMPPFSVGDSFDEICCENGVSFSDIEIPVRQAPNCVIIAK